MQSGETIVTWNGPKGALRLRLLGETVGRDGDPYLLVCKEECLSPVMGTFAVRADAVMPA